MSSVNMAIALLLALCTVSSLLTVTAVPFAPSEDGDGSEYPFGDIRNCPAMSKVNNKMPLLRMKALAGGGFDNLRNMDMGQVFFYNYSSCKISADGQYLLPDSIFLIPEQQSRVDVFAEYFDHWDNYTSTTSTSINVGSTVTFADISGKFSTEWKTVKEKQYRTKSRTTRVQIRHKLYSVHIQPNSQLNPMFKAMLFEIAANLQRNNTQYANYLADLVIHNYGTHYIRTMAVGAVLMQLDQVKEKFATKYRNDITKITSSASATLFDVLNLSSSFEYLKSNADLSGFISNRTHSQVFTYGGPPFRFDSTISDWEDGIRSELAPIDRVGDPLYYAVNPFTLPELVDYDIFKVQDIIFNATRRYYLANTVHGCIDRNAKNFAFTANVDDGSCNAVGKNTSFGGVYQTCTPNSTPRNINLCNDKELNQVNTFTGDYRCPDGYQPVELFSETLIQHGSYTEKYCRFRLLFCFKKKKRRVSYTSSATYTTYWCAPTPTDEPAIGYLFGGAFTSNQINPATNAMSCPMYFQEFKMGVDGTVCASGNFDLAHRFSIPFAGFESCRVGNPLSANNSTTWLHDCPPGFSKYLMMVQSGCEISYCIKSGFFDTETLPPARLPPFSKPILTDVQMVLIGRNGKVWIKNDDAFWSVATEEQLQEVREALSLDDSSPPSNVTEESLRADEPSDGLNVDNRSNGLNVDNRSNGTEEEDIMSNATDKVDNLSNGAVAAISVVTTTLVCTIIAFAIFVCVRKSDLLKNKYETV